MQLIKIIVAVFLCAAVTEAEEVSLYKRKWPFDGIWGYFDKTSIQRGFKVYHEVCQTCHSLKFVSYRDLQKIGFSAAEIKAIAAEHSVETINDNGDRVKTSASVNDKILFSFDNEQAARAANNGTLPPDLSLIVKARPGGADYLFSLLNGYVEPPVGVDLAANMSYNQFFPSKQIAMPPPLTEGLVTYGDYQPTIEQMSYDVANFLQWTAEPEMEHRKNTGIKSILYLAVFTILFFLLKRRIWQKIK